MNSCSASPNVAVGRADAISAMLVCSRSAEPSFAANRGRRSCGAWHDARAVDAVLFVAVMPLVSHCPAQLSQPCRFLMLHPLEHVRDHQASLADTLAPPGLALIAIQALRKLRLRRRVSPRVARTRRQPTQLDPMQQPVGARQAAINLKLLLQYSLRIDRTKRHYPVPLQLGASDNPFLEPRARHGVDPWLSARARPVTQSLSMPASPIPWGGVGAVDD